MTDLPYGRGGSPSQNLIKRKHRATKITAILCDNGLDTGDIYLKEDLSLEGSAEEIFLRADKIIEHMIEEIVRTEPVPILKLELQSYSRGENHLRAILTRARQVM